MILQLVPEHRCEFHDKVNLHGVAFDCMCHPTLGTTYKYSRRVEDPIGKSQWTSTIFSTSVYVSIYSSDSLPWFTPDDHDIKTSMSSDLYTDAHPPATLYPPAVHETFTLSFYLTFGLASNSWNCPPILPCITIHAPLKQLICSALTCDLCPSSIGHVSLP